MSDTFPPENYVRTESAVSGIEVYLPRPPQEEHKEVVDFRCPNCDGVTAFSTDDGGLTCSFCGYHEAPPQEVVGKGAEEFEFTVETMERVAHGWGESRKELVCNSCAAHTTLSVDMLTHTCPFCGSNQVVQVKAPQDVLRPRFLVPFRTTTDDCRRQTAVWLGNSWMLPQDLQRLARTAEYVPIYIPFWTFDARTKAEWRAEVAHTRRKRVYSGGKWRTKTVTEWKWESGRVNLFHDDLLENGSSQLSPVLLQKVRRTDLRELVPYDPSFLAGIQAQAYDVGLDAAWENGRHIMRLRTKKACKAQASSQRMRNFSMSLDFNEESWRYILLPLYLATYRYGDESYQVIINGQTGVLAGQRPVDWQKVVLAILAALSPAVIAGIVALVLGQSPNTVDTGAIVGLVAGLLLVGALIFAFHTFQTARAMDDI